MLPDHPKPKFKPFLSLKMRERERAICYTLSKIKGKQMKTPYKILILALSLLLFTACGEGSGGDDPTAKDVAIAHIIEYAENGGTPPTLQDYLDAGVTGVTEDNLDDINEVVENLTEEEVDTTQEIQALADELGIVEVPTTITHNGTTYGFVTSPYTGKVWLDRNLGAAQVCTLATDTACYGDYYQWGRDADGHEDSTSGTTVTQATDVNSAGSSFITGSNDWASVDGAGTARTANWSATDGSSVCPVGYRVPDIDELKAETLDATNVTGSTKLVNGATAFTNFLKLPSAGYHNYFDGSVVGAWGVVWASSVEGSDSHNVYFNSSDAVWDSDYRAYGFSVRCLRD